MLKFSQLQTLSEVPFERIYQSVIFPHSEANVELKKKKNIFETIDIFFHSVSSKFEGVKLH